MQLITVKIDKPDDTNFILGQTHFIKSVEDIHEALVGAVPGIKFGLAFCEASGKCLVRWSGTDAAMIELAKKNAVAIGAGHSFILFLGDGFYPLNVLNTLKMVPDVCRIFSASTIPRRSSLSIPSKAGVSWVWWMASRPRASRTKPRSNGERTSCGKSATSSDRQFLTGNRARLIDAGDYRGGYDLFILVLDVADGPIRLVLQFDVKPQRFYRQRFGKRSRSAFRGLLPGTLNSDREPGSGP